MFQLSLTAKILALVFLATSMLSIGLQAGSEGLKSVFAAKGLLLRAVVANFLLVPIVGIALAKALPLAPAIALTLILLACTPGGVSALQFTSRLKGEAGLAGALACLLSALSLVLSPALLSVILPSEIGFALHRRSFAVLGGALVLPLIVGVRLSDSRPAASARMAKGMAVVSLVAFLGFMIANKPVRSEAMESIGIPAVATLGLFLVLSMAIGWLLGGPGRGGRQILATATGMRNAAFCIGIVQDAPSRATLTTPLLAFSLLMVPPTSVFTVYQSVRARLVARRLRRSGAESARPAAGGGRGT